MLETLPRLVTEIKIVDRWVDDTVGQIEAARNVTVSPPLQAMRTQNGLHLSCAIPAVTRLAKTGGSGIPAISGSTLGSADATLYNLNNGVLASETITDKVYNMSSRTIGANKMILCAQVGNCWVAFWEDC